MIAKLLSAEEAPPEDEFIFTGVRVVVGVAMLREVDVVVIVIIDVAFPAPDPECLG